MLQRDDDELAARALADLAALAGSLAGRWPSAVPRWGGGLPQYGRRATWTAVARLRRRGRRRRRARGCGAAFDGVGIPACVRRRRRRRPDPGRRRRTCGARGTDEWWHDELAAARSAQGARDQRHDPVHDVVGVPVDDAAGRLPRGPARAARPRWTALIEELAAKDVVVRGWYDVAGLRADADLMVWWHAADVETLQEAYHRPAPHRARAGTCEPVWSRDGAAPSGRVQQEPRAGVPGRRGAAGYLCVYPFVRSYEWYLLPDEERRAHARRARHDGRGRTPTCGPTRWPSFALGDYEWILAFEADELHRIVDLMRAPAGGRRPPARPRGGAVLHRPPAAAAGARLGPAVTDSARLT